MIGSGKSIRWPRLVRSESGKGLIVPIDHGLTMGPISGLEAMGDIESWIEHPAIDAVIGHKGTIERLGGAGHLTDVGVVVHLNGMPTLAPEPDTKEMLSSVESAVRLGADAVSVQASFTEDNYAHNLKTLADVEEAASHYGLVVLAMVYDKVETGDEEERLTRHRHLIRAAIELGVDVVKTEPPRRIADLPHLLEGLSEDVAMFFSGGELRAEDEMEHFAGVIGASEAKGLCVGRNVFQHPDANALLGRLRDALDAPVTDRYAVPR
jgi:fructose-bisphosphate aldolase, class I